jgi:ubiquinone/menaquinone biosynthesis C-methylase UbiE
LENYYQTNPVLTQLRNSAVHYAAGSGEKLPFENDCFLLVIFDNVLDHVHNAIGVLHEIQRALSQDGSLYLVVNIHTKWGSFVHSILSKLKIDKGHPYTFTFNSIRRFLKDGGFIVSYEKLEDYSQIKRKNCQAKNLKDKMKGYSGISEIVYTCICRKNSFNLISQGAHDNGRKKVF